MTRRLVRERGTPAFLENSAGEIERERVSRRANLLEAVGLYLLLLAVWWGCLGAPSRRPGLEWLQPFGISIISAAVLWVFVWAPRVHGDGWHTFGLARPLALVAVARERDGASTRFAAIVTAAVFAVAALLVWLNWDYLLIRLGVHLAAPGAYRTLTHAPWRGVGQAATAGSLAVLFVVFGIRWDNLPSSLRAVGWLAVLFGGGIELVTVLVASVTGHWDLFTAFRWTGTSSKAVFTHFALYMLWAPLQQLFVLGYLNTRIRKAVPPAPWGLPCGQGVTAVMTGLAFGGLHLPGWPLVVITFAGGCAYGWLFQRDRYRNLFAVGVAHALIGTLVATTTSIDMVVGP